MCNKWLGYSEIGASGSIAYKCNRAGRVKKHIRSGALSPRSGSPCVAMVNHPSGPVQAPLGWDQSRMKLPILLFPGVWTCLGSTVLVEIREGNKWVKY